MIMVTIVEEETEVLFFLEYKMSKYTIIVAKNVDKNWGNYCVVLCILVARMQSPIMGLNRCELYIYI